MFNSKLVGACFALMLAFSLNAEAKLYKWVDDQGVTHYGEVIPPEYANKERDSLKKSGLLEKRPEKVDPNTVRAKEEAERKRKVDSQQAMEQQRRDSALLNTYSNEKEIDMAQERSEVLINARIDSNKMLLKSSQTSLDELRKEADVLSKSGKKIPASLTKDIAERESRVQNYSADLVKSEKDLAAVRSRFENEKALYRKLKGGTSSK